MASALQDIFDYDSLQRTYHLVILSSYCRLARGAPTTPLDLLSQWVSAIFLQSRVCWASWTFLSHFGMSTSVVLIWL